MENENNKKEICLGLAKVCNFLAKENPNKREIYEKQAKVFESLANIKNIQEDKKMAIQITKQEKDKQFDEKRKQVIKELEIIEKKYGSILFKSACNRKLTIDRQRIKTLQEIKRRELELERLKRGVPLPQY